MTPRRPLGKRKASRHAAAIVEDMTSHLERARDCAAQSKLLTTVGGGGGCGPAGDGGLWGRMRLLAAQTTQKHHQMTVGMCSYFLIEKSP